MKERKQSGVVPYRYKNGVLQILLISRDKDVWGLPKGGLSKGMTETGSALKEAYEEAGISGNIGDFVGATRYEKQGTPQLVKWYLMSVDEKHKHYPEKAQRYRKWFRAQDALEHVRSRCRPALTSALTRLK